MACRWRNCHFWVHLHEPAEVWFPFQSPRGSACVLTMCRFISDLKQTLLKSSSVDNEKVNKVFGNIESLYLISSNIYAKCDEEVRKHDNDYDKSNLGKVIGNLAAYLKLYAWTVPLTICRYTEYINCYKESLDIVADSSEKKDAFYNECEKAKKNMNVTMDLGVSSSPRWIHPL